MMMVSLLDLPLELRLKIFDFAIHADRLPPREFSDDESRVGMARKPHLYSSFSGNKIRYESDPDVYRSNASRLRAVNHQFKKEVDTLTNSSTVVYKFDLAIMQGRMLWPTWTSIPVHRSTADLVEVKIRVAGPGIPCARFLRGGDGGPPLWFWWFYGVLEHFFTVGIAPQEVDESEPRVERGRKQMMAVRVLDLDFIDPLVPYEECPGSRMSSTNPVQNTDEQNNSTAKCIHCQRSCHTRSSNKNRNFQTEWLYVRIVDMFFLLLKTTSMLYYGEILYRGVETVRFRLKGDLMYELDLSEWLRRWPMAEDESGQSEWLKETYAIRERFGLKNLARAERSDCTFSDQEVWATLDNALAAVRMDGSEEE